MTLSLIYACCKKLSESIHMVDSLVGIPEHIGQLIFQLMGSDWTPHAVALFSEAYSSEFIHSIALRGLEPLPSWILCLSKSSCLSSLCLDHCELGLRDNAIGSFSLLGCFPVLKLLSLRYNNICNDHIRALTAPCRYKSVAFRLACLDLSGNGYVGEKAVKLILGIPLVKIVYLCDTGVSVSSFVSFGYFLLLCECNLDVISVRL